MRSTARKVQQHGDDDSLSPACRKDKLSGSSVRWCDGSRFIWHLRFREASGRDVRRGPELCDMCTRRPSPCPSKELWPKSPIHANGPLICCVGRACLEIITGGPIAVSESGEAEHGRESVTLFWNHDPSALCTIVWRPRILAASNRTGLRSDLGNRQKWLQDANSSSWLVG